MRAVLTYHSIDDSGSPISIGPAEFDAHRRWFASRRVRVLPLSTLLGHPADGEDAVAITFDDGFRNTREPIAALLAEGLPVSLFVVSHHVGQTNAWRGSGDAGIPTMPLLDWEDLARLHSAGAAIEGHTRTHPFLTGLSDAALDDEIGAGQADLRAKIGDSARYFAYPYGDLDGRVLSRARQFYAAGCTTDFNALEVIRDPMLLPRLDMYYFRAPGRLEAWGTAGFPNRLRWIRTRRRVKQLLAAKGK